MISIVETQKNTNNSLKTTPKFTFNLIHDAKYPGFSSKDVQDRLYKWGMKDNSYILKFAYDQFFQPYQIDDFLLDFLNDPNVNSSIRVLGSNDRWGSIGTVSKVEKEENLHSVTSLSFFDRLTNVGVVRKNGDIAKCLDEYVDGFLVADELRKCLLMPECENYEIFDENDRREFIFHLFKALCLGGKLCQYEDEIKPYLDTTKLLYKDLISVVKDASTGKLRVASHVYKINNLENSNSPLFPLEHPQNFCYVCVDPVRRHVHVWYHASDVYY